MTEEELRSTIVRMIMELSEEDCLKILADLNRTNPPYSSLGADQ